jgi:hypothetical protein
LQLGDAFERDLKCKRLCAWRCAEWGWAQGQQNGQPLGGQGRAATHLHGSEFVSVAKTQMRCPEGRDAQKSDTHEPWACCGRNAKVKVRACKRVKRHRRHTTHTHLTHTHTHHAYGHVATTTTGQEVSQSNKGDRGHKKECSVCKSGGPRVRGGGRVTNRGERRRLR